MKKQIRLELFKDSSGIVASNPTDGQIDFFPETDEGRQDFVKFMVDAFLNKELEDGKEYR